MLWNMPTTLHSSKFIEEKSIKHIKHKDTVFGSRNPWTTSNWVWELVQGKGARDQTIKKKALKICHMRFCFINDPD